MNWSQIVTGSSHTPTNIHIQSVCFSPEQGVAMLSTVLKSETAIHTQASVLLKLFVAMKFPHEQCLNISSVMERLEM